MIDRDTDSTRDAGTMTALLCLMVAAFLFMLLVVMVLPHLIGIVIVGGLFFGMFALHYLVWGRWLKITVDSEDEASTPAASRREPVDPR